MDGRHQPGEGRVLWLIVFCLVTTHNGFRSRPGQINKYSRSCARQSVIYDVLSKRRVVESRGIARGKDI